MKYRADVLRSHPFDTRRVVVRSRTFDTLLRAKLWVRWQAVLEYWKTPEVFGIHWGIKEIK